MLNHENPNGWDYDDHPGRAKIKARCIILGSNLISRSGDFLEKKSRYKDTRRAHKYIFRLFTPPRYTYYAGNYRGSNHPILKSYNVCIPSDPKVGLIAPRVKQQMAVFDKQFEESMDRFSGLFASGKQSKAVLLVLLVEQLANYLVRFLTIHPYANGNGHMARLLVLAMLGRVGIAPAAWTLDDRPPYDKAIFDYRRGNFKPLARVILECIVGQKVAAAA